MLLIGAPAVVALSLMLGDGPFGYFDVKPQVYDRERKAVPDIWVLDFTFRQPRYIMANDPVNGRKLYWYMTYKLVNRTGEPRTFIPSFVLKTDKGKIHKDVILPKAEESVRLRENPTQPLYNSVTISKSPVPPTKAEGTPIERYGVVFWEDVDMLNTKSFEIIVTGLSNGYKRGVDPKSKQEKTYRKTLVLSFNKPGDDHWPTPKEIKMAGDPAWDYR